MVPYQLPGASVYTSNRRLLIMILEGTVTMAGNKKLKIYGTFACPSGKRMKATNRVLFRDVKDALDHGFRPCGHCSKAAYKLWKQQQSK